MNKYYSYPSISLWEPESWEHRNAAVDPLMSTIVPLVYEQRCGVNAGPGPYDGRTDGVYDPKSHMYTFPEVVRRWEDKGLHYHCTSMDFVAWMAMLPRDAAEGAAVDPKVIVVPHCVDISNPCWAMNMLEQMADYNELAIRENVSLLYLVFRRPQSAGIYMDIMLELSAIFRIDMRHTYLDLSALKQAGMALSDVPGFDPSAFPAEEEIGGLPVLNITDRWVARIGHQFIVANLNRNKPDFDAQRHIHSTVGRLMADSMFMEHEFDSAEDPRLIAFWEQKGLVYESHRSCGERWLTFAPKAALEEGKKLPLLIAMKEVRDIAPFLTLTAFQFYYHYLDIAANGECMVLFFALETPGDNDMLADILAEAEGIYPIDPERVYIAGQSHNGYMAVEFARRHPDIITAVSQLNDRHYINAPGYSLDNVIWDDEMVEDMAKHDMPLINICGHAENVFAHTRPGTEEFEQACIGYQRRLRAFRCKEKTLEEIRTAHKSPDLATRKNAVPADRTEVRYSMGDEVYISHLQNTDGNWHLDLVSIENMPHMITPQMAELSWSFMRRFARDQKTGKIKELY